MPNLYQKKLIRGTCDLIWKVGDFGCLACRYHCTYQVKCCMGQSISNTYGHISVN